jgi:plastocyanin
MLVMVAFQSRGLRLVAAALVLTLGMAGAGAGLASAAGAFNTDAKPVMSQHFTVLVGGGQQEDFTNLQYTPLVLNITVGDTVTFRSPSPVEPHTVTFGPRKVLDALARAFITPIPSKNGPPILRLSTVGILPTPSHVISSHGFANSGVLSSLYTGITKTSWTVRFTKPGKYHYFCLIHYPIMSGWIFVHPQPQPTRLWRVGAGYSLKYSTADTYFPENLRIHAGDTVEWLSDFHTVTFASNAQLDALRHRFVVKSTGPGGKPLYQINPAVFLPSNQSGCGTGTPCVYAGGYLNSGLLQGTSKPAIFKVTFTKPGMYHYGCLVHPGMEGNIDVLPARTGKG